MSEIKTSLGSYLVRELKIATPLMILNSDDHAGAVVDKLSILEQIRYRCPQCRLRVFGKADLWVVCGECRCALEED